MSGDDSEKSHEPTPKRLEDARKRGEIVRSVEIGTAAGYLGILLALLIFGAYLAQNLGAFLAAILSNPEAISPSVLIWRTSEIVMPLFVVPMMFVALSYGMQRAVIFTPGKLAPKLSRLSIISNAKNKFGASGLFEFGKSLLKLSIFAAVLAALLGRRAEVIATLSYAEPIQIMQFVFRQSLIFLAAVAAIAICVAGIDYLWQYFSHMRKNRMSRKELTDEMKESEGDPGLKGRRRQKAVDIALNQILTDVPTADVVIVNPTHFAVALAWDRESGRAPTCVAKGVDEIAAQIRRVAQENGVPVRSDPPTARALYATVEIGADIPVSQYRAVAAAIRFAERIRKKAASR